MVLPGGDPEFRCRSCGTERGRESDPTAAEQALADLLGVAYRDVVRALGTGWRREELASGEDVHWFVSGEPSQVAIGVSGPTFVLARTLTEWGGVRRDVLPPDDGRFTRDDLLWVPEMVADAVEVIASTASALVPVVPGLPPLARTRDVPGRRRDTTWIELVPTSGAVSTG